MGLDLVRMPPEISRGFVAVMDFGNDIVSVDGGLREERVRTREMPELRWQATKGIFEATRLDEFFGFMRARFGAFHGFRFVDLADFSTNPTNPRAAPSALDQFLGYGDGSTVEFDLRRVYESTTTDLPQRLGVEDRFLPIVGETDARLAKCIGVSTSTTFNPLVAVDAVVQTSGVTFNIRRRTLRFSVAPDPGAVITWGGYYDWPVRLGEDADRNLEAIRESWTAGNVPNIPLVGIPFDRMVPETDDPGGAASLSWGAGVPVINKVEAKVWELTPGASGLSVALQDPSDVNYGGPHFMLLNRSGTYSCTLVDELTGATITTLAAQPSGTAGALVFLRGTGSSRAWFTVAVPA